MDPLDLKVHTSFKNEHGKVVKLDIDPVEPLSRKRRADVQLTSIKMSGSTQKVDLTLSVQEAYALAKNIIKFDWRDVLLPAPIRVMEQGGFLEPLLDPKRANVQDAKLPFDAVLKSTMPEDVPLDLKGMEELGAGVFGKVVALPDGKRVLKRQPVSHESACILFHDWKMGRDGPANEIKALMKMQGVIGVPTLYGWRLLRNKQQDGKTLFPEQGRSFLAETDVPFEDNKDYLGFVVDICMERGGFPMGGAKGQELLTSLGPAGMKSVVCQYMLFMHHLAQRGLLHSDAHTFNLLIQPTTEPGLILREAGGIQIPFSGVRLMIIDYGTVCSFRRMPSPEIALFQAMMLRIHVDILRLTEFASGLHYMMDTVGMRDRGGSAMQELLVSAHVYVHRLMSNQMLVRELAELTQSIEPTDLTYALAALHPKIWWELAAVDSSRLSTTYKPPAYCLPYNHLLFLVKNKSKTDQLDTLCEFAALTL